MSKVAGGGAGPPVHPELAHLPDASEELASIADLEISVEGRSLQLHSAVLASGSRVLRSALCGWRSAGDSPTAADASAATAVRHAFEGHSAAEVQLFLRLLYNPMAIEGYGADVLPLLQGVLKLADKLDAPAVLQACDGHLARLLPEDVDWTDWLLLADRMQLRRLAARCARPVVRELFLAGSPTDVKAQLLALAPLGPRSLHLLLEALLRTGRGAGSSRGRTADYVPQTADWQELGDLFS